MKKYILFAFLGLVTFAFTGCDDSDTDPGGTAVQDMAGQWDVSLYDVKADGTTGDEEAPFTLTTYNTAANTADSMWVAGLSDYSKYGLNFQSKVGINYAAKTFEGTVTRVYGDKSSGTITIKNGKVLPGAATSLHGMPNDSIVFDIVYSDDPNTTYRVSGQRYTGFTE